MNRELSRARTKTRRCLVGFVALAFLAPACADDQSADAGETGGGVDVPERYEFESRFLPGESSVSYSGQSVRQVLVLALTQEIELIQSEIEGGKIFVAGEAAARLEFYYRFDSDSAGSLAHGLETTPSPLQASWDDISSGKDLEGKVAGNDPIGQHKDWASELQGWESATSPDALIEDWISELDTMAVAYSEGNIPSDPNGVQISKFYVSAQGHDYQQLIAKFLLGALNFSQAADDYLDADLEDQGLRASNSAAVDTKGYSQLEHHWDEAFGYWGGARDYLDYSDDELSAAGGREDHALGYHDADQDGAIDLRSEFNFSASVNAAKRDRGSVSPTDFSTETMTAFLTGRAIISQADGVLSDAQFADLLAQRDIALLGWEKSLAATCVHYVNDSVQDMEATDYDFVSHAKHFAELKGFALSLQFNPHSSLSDAQFTQLHTLLGTRAFVPGGADGDAHRAGLLGARALLAEAYGFDPSNLGDDAGLGGW